MYSGSIFNAKDVKIFGQQFFIFYFCKIVFFTENFQRKNKQNDLFFSNHYRIFTVHVNIMGGEKVWLFFSQTK